MTNIKKETYKIPQDKITLTHEELNHNILTVTCTEENPTNISSTEFTAAVWSATNKAVKALHIETYKNTSSDMAVINAVYKVTYGKETKTITIPLIDLLQGDSKTEYNNKANMLQTATAKYMNKTFDGKDENARKKQRANARIATEKEYKQILQWAFDFLTSERTDGRKIYVNCKDVDLISGQLLKRKSESLLTVGEKAIQGHIEFAYRQKIADKPILVTLYSINKLTDNTILTAVAEMATDSDEEPTAETVE